MKKKELIKIISSRTGFSIKKSTEILNSFMEVIKDSLKEGEKITLSSFGSFKLAIEDERMFHNISTKKVETLPKRTKLKFVPFKQLKEAIDNPQKSLQDNDFGGAVVMDKAPESESLTSDIKIKDHGKKVSPSTKNVGKRRNEDTSEFHDNKFEYIGFVDYDIYFGENDHTLFPSVKTPCKGTKILKWYKSHKDAVVGVSEPLLVAEVEKLCQKYTGLTLLEKVAIPIKNREYSYRPDFALYWDKFNICIDIEIDEPYDICSHKPLHYIGCSDNLRDTYFTRNGWCVIRYSENQVLNHLSEIIKHLEFVINWLSQNTHPNYDLFDENRWTFDEASQMAQSIQREKNLGIEENQILSVESNQITDSSPVVFIKPDIDILPEQTELSHDSMIEAQLNYALASNVQHVRITDINGYQWILERDTIQKGKDEGDIYFTGNNPITPALSSSKYKLKTISQIEAFSTLFTKDDWKSGDISSVKSILIKAASKGSPLWIKYRNSQGEYSERFLSNICLFLNYIEAEKPFTDLGTIADPQINWRTYILGLCSIRNEFRQFACDDRLLEVKIINCNYNYIFPEVYENSLCELVMNPYKYSMHYVDRVDYLLSIMPEQEKNSLISKGNIANYEVVKGNINTAFDLYTSIPFDKIMLETENQKYLWGNVCIDDINKLIQIYQEENSANWDNDITPSKVVENFTKIKSMLIEYGWKWN